MAEATESFYKDVMRAGYRGPYLRSLAASVAEGSLDLEELSSTPREELTDEEVTAQLLALPGVGPYAAAHVMMLVGRYSPDRVLARARRESYNLARIALEAPYQVHDVLEELRDGTIEVGFVHKGLEDFVHRLAVAMNRLVIALVVAGGLIGSSLIGIFADEGPQLLGLHVLSVLGFLLSGLLGVWLLWGVIRSGRL